MAVGTAARRAALTASPLKGRPGGGPRGRGNGGSGALVRRTATDGSVWRHGRRSWRLVAAIFAVCALPVPVAQADEQPAILKAYGLDWIERVREEAWPQPKAERPVICLLDTGVAITPDTPADNPEGPIVARLSVEDKPAGESGGSLGIPQGATFAHFHGTRMAATIGAPRNGVGTVGVFPQARIVSVRVTSGSETFIAPADLVAGVRRCIQWASANGARLGAVVMAESSYEQRAVDAKWWLTAAADSRLNGGVFVAAAGNSPAESPVPPLGVEGVIAIGAGDDAGVACPFNPDVSKAPGVLLAPGCSVTRPGISPGSSTSAAIVGAFVSVLATRQPSLSTAELEALTRGAVIAAGGAVRLDGSTRARDFDNLISPPPAPPHQQSVSGLAISPEAPVVQTDQRLKMTRPKVVATWRRSRLTVRVTSRRKTGVVCAKVVGRPETWCGGRTKLRVRTSRRPTAVVAWLESEDRKTWRSLSSRVRVSR